MEILRNLWNQLSGRKSYMACAFLMGFGLWTLMSAPTVTFDDPSAGLRRAVAEVVGFLFLGLGFGLAALRHAISTSHEKQMTTLFRLRSAVTRLLK